MDCSQYKATTGDGVQLRVYRLSAGEDTGQPPVILIHGTYANSRFWLSDKGIGLAAFLNSRGHDIWMPELRGRGPSANAPGYARWRADHVMRHDLAAVAALVEEDHGLSAIWIGHSFGGLYIIGALASRWLRSDQVSAVAVFGTQFRKGQRFLRFRPLTWFLRSLVKALGYFPARRLGMGSENEPPGVMTEALYWKSTGRWEGEDGLRYEEGLGALSVPVLAYAGAADTTDPAAGCRAFYEALGSPGKEFRLLGKETGFTRDYGHVDMLVSKQAQQEVWPDLAKWLERQGQTSKSAP